MPNQAAWTVFVICAHWRGSTLAIYKTVLIIFPLNLQTITITLDVYRAGLNFEEPVRSSAHSALMMHYMIQIRTLTIDIVQDNSWIAWGTWLVTSCRVSTAMQVAL